MRKITLYLVFFIAVITLLTGCSAIGGNNSSKVSRNGPAIIPPQTDGKIKSIKAGNPSYVILNDVTIINKGHVQVYKSMLKVELPNGHFISPNHWQSEGETLDLFIGDAFMMINGHIMDSAANAPNFEGIVKSVSSDKMVIQKVLYANTSDSHGMKYTNETATIHLAPYTIVSLNGGKDVKTSEIKEGDAVLLILIGPPDNYIATQITDFHDIADVWNMVNKPQQ